MTCPALATDHRVFPLGPMRVPAPFRSFAVRSEEAMHAMQARGVLGCVHVVDTRFLNEAALQRLATAGHARMALERFSDIDYAPTDFDELQALLQRGPDLAGEIAAALQLTGVLGGDVSGARRQVEARVDFLGCCGAGFHNDVARHWSRCLFWLLVLDAAGVEFVMPHAGLHLPLAPGALLVFDPALAHGLCRPGDGGLALAASFDSGPRRTQMFLTGELLLDDAMWAALGAPWRPVAWHAQQGALDLLVAGFDDRSGAIQRLQALRGGMAGDVCHVGDGD